MPKRRPAKNLKLREQSLWVWLMWGFALVLGLGLVIAALKLVGLGVQLSLQLAQNLVWGVGLLLWKTLWLWFPLLAIGYGLWRQQQWQRQNQQRELNQAFYELIQLQQGKVTVLEFAMKTHLTGEEARCYLDDRAKEFSALFEVGDQGEMIYLFPNSKHDESLRVEGK